MGMTPFLSSSRRRGPIRRVDIVSRKLDSLFQGNDSLRRLTAKIILNGYAVRNQPQHAACDRLHQPHPYVKDRRVDFVSKKGGVPFIPRFRDPKGASCAANRRMGPRFLGDDTLSSSLR